MLIASKLAPYAEARVVLWTGTEVWADTAAFLIDSEEPEVTVTQTWSCCSSMSEPGAPSSEGHGSCPNNKPLLSAGDTVVAAAAAGIKIKN